MAEKPRTLNFVKLQVQNNQTKEIVDTLTRVEIRDGDNIVSDCTLDMYASLQAAEILLQIVISAVRSVKKTRVADASEPPSTTLQQQTSLSPDEHTKAL